MFQKLSGEREIWKNYKDGFTEVLQPERLYNLHPEVLHQKALHP